MHTARRRPTGCTLPAVSRPLLIIILLLLNITLINHNKLLYCYGQQQQGVLTTEGEDGSVGKDLPEKGDTKCPSLADRFNYFTNRNGSDDSQTAAEDIWLLPCKETDTTATTTGSSSDSDNTMDYP